jgi:hypothetical protein
VGAGQQLVSRQRSPTQLFRRSFSDEDSFSVTRRAMMEFFWDRNASDSDNPKPPPDYNKHLHNIEFPSHAIDDLDELINNSSASFTQIPMSIIIERVEKGDILLQDLIRIFHVFSPFSPFLISSQNRIDLEEKDIYYSKQFSKAVLSENEIPMSSTAEALRFLFPPTTTPSPHLRPLFLSAPSKTIITNYQMNKPKSVTNINKIFNRISLITTPSILTLL